MIFKLNCVRMNLNSSSKPSSFQFAEPPTQKYRILFSPMQSLYAELAKNSKVISVKFYMGFFLPSEPIG